VRTQEELASILKNYVGRESPLYHAERLSEYYRKCAVLLSPCACAMHHCVSSSWQRAVRARLAVGLPGRVLATALSCR